ncbi:hypothetical protein [Nonomuraea typhae]|uniref:Uncharacterized protein n=1 Tax=Nonomuraea typhae TaxID=2603600 RepID=A0ABW7YJ94_9ACTN
MREPRFYESRRALWPEHDEELNHNGIVRDVWRLAWQDGYFVADAEMTIEEDCFGSRQIVLRARVMAFPRPNFSTKEN